MGIMTGISWADATQNFWTGCTKCSPGCKNCYMFRENHRWGRDPSVVSRSKSTFENPWKWKKSWYLKPGSFIFTCSWSDFFHPDADEWRDDAYNVIGRTQEYTYLILTKRPHLISDRLPVAGLPANVVLGVTGEAASEYTARVSALRWIDAPHKFVSIEPMIGPVDIDVVPDCKIAGIIVGGETGPRTVARPMHPHWVRDVRDACERRNIPFTFKSWGTWKPLGYLRDDDGRSWKLPFVMGIDVDGRTWNNGNKKPFIPSNDAYLMTPSKGARNHLDGQIHSEFPRLAGIKGGG